MAVYGWETLKQAEIYTRQADRKRLTRQSMHLVKLPENKRGA